MEKETFVIVALGNPGAQYAHTRHNAGFDTLEALERRWMVTTDRSRCKGLLCETQYNGQRVVLCRPQTFMNLSGECVAELLNWYKIPLDHLLVIHDDIDIPSAHLRMRKKGSAGTHNGMRSILQHTPGQDFPRLRVGVGACPPQWQLVDWVLGHYLNAEEQKSMNEAFERGALVIEDWIKNGIDHAMQLANQNPAPKA